VFYSGRRGLDPNRWCSPNATTQSQNVGNGHFYGVEAFLPRSASLRIASAPAANLTHIRRTITDALLPNLRATGVPENKLVLYATWRPTNGLAFTPSVEATDDRWSDKNHEPPCRRFPFVETGAYTLAECRTWDLPPTEPGSSSRSASRICSTRTTSSRGATPEVGRNRRYMKFRVAF